ncbi:MAG: hypothetical protein J6L86_02015 [Alphaproteobacteria bacterium]|nr:hypothetical protein [Alphaproteobacteria bacterium]
MNTQVSSQSAATTVMNNAMVLKAPVAGAVPVAIVRYSGQVNLYEYHRPNVTAVIPAWKCPDGSVIAVKDGKPVTTGTVVWDLHSGSNFRYDDGCQILLTRGLYGKRELFFVSGKEADKSYMQVNPAFIKEIKKKNWWEA